MASKRTLRALEELIKTEYMAVSALDAALEEVDDNKLRRQYKKFRDSHMKQAESLNDRLEDLGGEPLEYEVGSGRGQGGLWGRLTGASDDFSLMGMRIGAERGLKRYIDHIDDIEDPKALNIVRKNLESKQDEMHWYDDQAGRDHDKKLDTKIEHQQEKAEDLAKAQKKGGLPFPLILLVGAIGGAAYFLLKRNEDSDFDDYSEDAFQYESGSDTSMDSGYSQSGSYSAGSSDYSTSNSGQGEA